jgi:5'-methylthioadenosine phosphorylase
VVFLPRHGRRHHLLPSELNHRANLWAMKKLGVSWLISVSAVGSLQTRYRPCDIVLPTQFVDRTKKSVDHTFFGRGIVAHIAFAHPICEELRRLLLASARRLHARVHDGGVYVNMEGPAFSTQAESMANHILGYDVIGMTNLGEAKCAREAEIAYATISMVTDYDAWRTDAKHVSVDQILDHLRRNAELAKAMIAQTVPLVPTTPCPCHSALQTAILTDRRHWPAQTKKRLQPILAKYLCRAAGARKPGTTA